MAIMTASAGEQGVGHDSNTASKAYIYESIGRLSNWLEKNDYRGYDTFDGLSAGFLRPFTFETKSLRIVLQQSVRRFPMNLRPMLGIRMEHSSKGMGFLARGFTRLHRSTGDPVWAGKAEMALQWLIENQSKGYSGACWGNHFDYQSRGGYLPKGVPTIVWTSLIGHAFLDGYEHFKEDQYLETAISACNHILHDYERHPYGEGLCINYVPGMDIQVHNANTLGASLLARTYSHIHIQCSSQAIDTLTFFSDYDSESLALAVRVARWTIEHMQDRTGYFYYRRYSRRIVNKTPTLHWGQATMLCALAGLYGHSE